MSYRTYRVDTQSRNCGNSLKFDILLPDSNLHFSIHRSNALPTDTRQIRPWVWTSRNMIVHLIYYSKMNISLFVSYQSVLNTHISQFFYALIIGYHEIFIVNLNSIIFVQHTLILTLEINYCCFHGTFLLVCNFIFPSEINTINWLVFI